MPHDPRYARRIVDAELDELMDVLSALNLDGAKGVGKTSTASERATAIFRLDDEGQRAVVAADPSRVAGAPPPVLIDEWHHVPSTWDVVRRAVDAGAAPGAFLLTGSALLRGLATHSGAGRIVDLRMRPMSLAERSLATPSVRLSDLLSGATPAIHGTSALKLEQYTEEILRSGMPGIRRLKGAAIRPQLDSYLARVIDREFQELGQRVRNPTALRRWMTAYAAATATTATWETIRDAASAGFSTKVSRKVTDHYGDVLQRLWLVDPVPGWTASRSHLRRVNQAPKHHLADPALAARLLGSTAERLLEGMTAAPPIPRDGTLLGALFESLATLSVRVYAQANNATVGHFRTRAGEHEVDLIVERPDGRILAIEVKLSAAVDDGDVRHLLWLRDQIGSDMLDMAVLTTGTDAYRRPDGVAVIPAVLLGP